MGFFNFDDDQLELSRQGWIYLACTFPLTFFVLGASFGWIWWTDPATYTRSLDRAPCPPNRWLPGCSWIDDSSSDWLGSLAAERPSRLRFNYKPFVWGPDLNMNQRTRMDYFIFRYC